VEVTQTRRPRVDTDVDKVRQVLKNFLANAVKFTDRGVVTLSAQSAAAPYRLALSVSDTGIGIRRTSRRRSSRPSSRPTDRPVGVTVGPDWA
jgi:signal transduction histidine kinase